MLGRTRRESTISFDCRQHPLRARSWQGPAVIDEKLAHSALRLYNFLMTDEELAQRFGFFVGALLVLIVTRVLAKKYRHESFEIIDSLFKIVMAMCGIGVVLFVVVLLTKSLT